MRGNLSKGEYELYLPSIDQEVSKTKKKKKQIK